MKKISLLLLSTLLLFFTYQPAVFAASYTSPTPAYVSLSSSNDSITDSKYMASDAYGSDSSVPFTSVYVSWKVQPGDTGRIDWFDLNKNLVSSTDLSSGMENVQSSTGSMPAPSGSYFAKITLNSSSASGYRYLYYSEVANAENLTLYPEPDLSNYVDPGTGGGGTGGGGTDATNTDLLNALNGIDSQLSTIIDNQGTLASDLQNVGSQLSQIISSQITMNNTLSSINSTLGNLYTYITTPRQSSPLNTSNLGSPPTFDPTVPPISGEPTQQPFTYTEPDPQLPAFIDSPGPLPAIPDPTTAVIPHDEPTTVNPPLSLSNPLDPESPKTAEDPVSPQTPTLAQTPLAPQAPLETSPVNMDPPLAITPVQMTDPITPETPLSPSQPYSAQAPLTPQIPLAPQPPLN